MSLQKLKMGYEYIATSKGTKSIKADRFKSYVDGAQFTFFYYADKTNLVHVSHRDSGKAISRIKRDDYRVSEKDYAKMAIGKLIDKHGADRVRCILTSAKAIL